LSLVVLSASSFAAEDDWLRLQTPEFTVISQLDEQKTRRWAGAFDQFVSALFKLYAIERKGLPPLTIILFDRTRNFAPYRSRTESGQVKNISGVFGRRDGIARSGCLARNPANTQPRSRALVFQCEQCRVAALVQRRFCRGVVDH
jgi:hypothetical protein